MEDNTNTSTNEATENNATGSEGQETKTYTQDEVLKLIQSEADKRVNQALATQQKKFDKQLSLSKLDDEARAAAEKDDKIAELEQKLAEFTVERNRSELKSVLGTRGLSAEFADIIVITDDLEASQSNIDKLDKLFKEAVKKEVEHRLTGKTPQGNGSSASPLTKAEFVKLPMAEMTRLMESNPDFYTKLLNS